MFGHTKHRVVADLQEKLRAVTERSNLLNEACGIGLWEAVLHKVIPRMNKAAGHGRLSSGACLDMTNERDFPNVFKSWADLMHPDDMGPTFEAFGKHLEDKTGRARYSVNYRLKTRDGFPIDGSGRPAAARISRMARSAPAVL